ncbi:MAG: mercury transporter MerT [Alphaproteobacteria bacterium]|nr:mercury transporter MerT [Alphaproteobacteria bacterium]
MAASGSGMIETTPPAGRAGSGRVGGRRQHLAAAGGILAALGAASCCVVPFALFTLGVSGAWIGDLTALEPYQPVFAAIAVACLGYGFYLVYRRPKVACAEASYCASPSSGRLAKIGLWTALVLVLIAVGFPHIAALFL